MNRLAICSETLRTLDVLDTPLKDEELAMPLGNLNIQMGGA